MYRKISCSTFPLFSRLEYKDNRFIKFYSFILLLFQPYCKCQKSSSMSIMSASMCSSICRSEITASIFSYRQSIYITSKSNTSLFSFEVYHSSCSIMFINYFFIWYSIFFELLSYVLCCFVFFKSYLRYLMKFSSEFFKKFFHYSSPSPLKTTFPSMIVYSTFASI